MDETMPFNIRVNKAAFKEFERVARAEHMEPQDLMRLLMGKFSEVKIGSALAALTSIPKDHFKGRPGRVPNEPAAVS